jgi:hypothetical protein
MLNDGVIFEVQCPSPSGTIGSHRIVAAAARFGAVGTQVVALVGRFSWNASKTVESFRDVDAVPETRSSSMPRLFAAVEFHVRRSAGAGSVGSPLAGPGEPDLATHLTHCGSRR